MVDCTVLRQQQSAEHKLYEPSNEQPVFQFVARLQPGQVMNVSLFLPAEDQYRSFEMWRASLLLWELQMRARLYRWNLSECRS